jgi:hypothetical protein
VKRRSEHNDDESVLWARFVLKLETVHAFGDAKTLVSEGPRLDTPGSRFYLNLAFFIDNLVPPRGASVREKLLYIQLIARINGSRALRPSRLQDRGPLRRSVPQRCWLRSWEAGFIPARLGRSQRHSQLCRITKAHPVAESNAYMLGATAKGRRNAD